MINEHSTVSLSVQITWPCSSPQLAHRAARLAGEPRHTGLCSAHMGHAEPWPEKVLGKERAALGQPSAGQGLSRMGCSMPSTSLSLSPALMAAFPWLWVPREAESGSPEGSGPRRIDSRTAAFHCLNWSCGRPCGPSHPCGTGDLHVSPAQERAVPPALCRVCLPLGWELTWSLLQRHQPTRPRVRAGGCQGLAAGRAEPCASVPAAGLQH